MNSTLTMPQAKHRKKSDQNLSDLSASIATLDKQRHAQSSVLEGLLKRVDAMDQKESTADKKRNTLDAAVSYAPVFNKQNSHPHCPVGQEKDMVSTTSLSFCNSSGGLRVIRDSKRTPFLKMVVFDFPAVRRPPQVPRTKRSCRNNAWRRRWSHLGYRG